MKNLLKMAFIAIAIFVTSCEKSDDGVSNKDLVGTWTAVSIFEGERSEELSECVKRTNIVFTETRFKMTPYEEDMLLQKLKKRNTSRGVALLYFICLDI